MLFDHVSKFFKGILLAIPNIPLLMLWFSERTATEKIVGTVIWLVFIVILAVVITRWRARRFNGGIPR